MKLLEPSSLSSLATWQVSCFSEISLSRLKSLPSQEESWRFFSEEESLSLKSRQALKNLGPEFQTTVEMSVSREDMNFSRPFMRDGLQTGLRFLYSRAEGGSVNPSLISGLSLGSQPVTLQQISKSDRDDLIEKNKKFIIPEVKNLGEFYALVVEPLEGEDKNSTFASLGYGKGQFLSGESYAQIFWYEVDRQSEKELRFFCHQRIGYGLMGEDVDFITVSLSLKDHHWLDFFTNKGFVVDSLLIKRSI